MTAVGTSVTYERPSMSVRIHARFAPPRIAGLDIARALAIIGMMAAHTMILGEHIVLGDPHTWGAIVSGRPSLLFALLGGISAALMTGRSTIPSPADLPRHRRRMLGRAAVIFLIGVALEMLGTSVLIILPLYGILYVLLLPFLNETPRQLLSWAACIALLGPTLLSVAFILFPFINGSGYHLLIQPTYSLAAWLPLMLVGLAIGRLVTNWRSPRLPWIFLGSGSTGMVAGYGLSALFHRITEGQAGSAASPGSAESTLASAGSSALSTTTAMSNNMSAAGGSSLSSTASTADLPSSEMGMSWENYWEALRQAPWRHSLSASLFDAAPHSGSTAEILGSGGFALVVIGLCLLATRLLGKALFPLAAMGSMPLTFYSAHIILILLIGGPANRMDSLAVFVALLISFLGLASLWMLRFQRGPLEQWTATASRRADRALSDPRPGEESMSL